MTEPKSESLNSIINELGKPYEDFKYLLTCLEEVIRADKRSASSIVPWLSEINAETLSNEELRIFSIAFHLLNIAEENGAIQYRRTREEKSGLESINGSWAQNFEALKEKSYSDKEIAEVLGNITIQPVLTAHPTEAVRATILEHHRDLYLQLVKRENNMWTPHEQDQIKNEVKAILERLIGTGEIFIEKPDLNAEVRNVIHYFTNSFPTVIPKIDENLRDSWEKAGFDKKLLTVPNMPKIKFGNWVGGDRDGHPFVTSEFTNNVLSQFRLNAVVVIRRVLVKLIKQLSFTIPIHEMPSYFIERMDQWSNEMPEQFGKIIMRNTNEAFRQFLSICLYKLPLSVKREHATELHEHEFAYTEKEELLDDLFIIKKALYDLNFNIAQSNVKESIRQVETIGFHLAEVDVRQNSTYHDKAIGQLISLAGGEDADYVEWSFEKKQAWLDEELKSIRPLSLISSEDDNEASKTVDCHKVLNGHIDKYGSDGIGVMIVSMTRHETDLYALYLLGRESGLTTLHNGKIVFKVPVVPLFETIEDLEASPEVMEAFLSHPITKDSLEYHKAKTGKENLEQLVMVGYSDSNKDGGILSSQWALFNSQSQLAEVGEKHGVKMQFFHGKGGTISRGAGPTHHFIKALPPSTINNKMRLTEQGESISQKYANPVNASFNLELLLANTLKCCITKQPEEKAEYQYADAFSYIAKASFDKYRTLVSHKHFLTFYGEATPIDVIESSKIGSRPARRTGKRTLADLRAIPWVFSWSQSRFNITGWFGVGTALAKLKEESPEKFNDLSKGVKDDQFIKYVFTNIETLLSSTKEHVIELYASLVQDKDAREQVLELILEELALTREMVTEMFGENLMQRRKNYALSNKLREEGLWKLHKTQVTLLKRWRMAKLEKSPDAETLLLSLLMSVNGIAGALKGTG